MAYQVKYTIPFVDVDDKPYIIEISAENWSGESTELIPGSNPIIVSYKDDDNIYNPLRFAGATITVLVEAPLFDLYAESPLQYKVDLKQEGKLRYTGFITPEVFSQDYNGYLTEFQIESISALSVLEYFKIEFPPEEKVTRLDFIKNENTYGLLNLAFGKIPDSYQSIFLPKIFNTSESTYTMAKYWMLYQNFLDDDGDAWTYKDFLEEFCKFWGWTLTEKDGKVYFLDIDYMKNNTAWFCYNGTMSALKTDNEEVFTLETQFLSEKESTGAGNEVSMVPAYNRVTIKDSDYEFSAEFPQLKNLKPYSGHTPKYCDKLFYTSKDKKSYRKNRNQPWNLYRYYTTNDKITLYVYDSNNKVYTTQNGYPTNFQTLDAYKGTRIERHQCFESTDRGKVEWQYGPVFVLKNFIGAVASDDHYNKNLNIKDTSAANTVLQDGGTNINRTGLKCLSVRTDPVVMSNTYLQIKCEAAITKEVAGAFTNRKLWHEDLYKDVSSNRKLFTYAIFRMGNWYWNGNTMRWTKTETPFKIYFSVASDDHTSTGDFHEIEPNQTKIQEGGFEGGYIIPVTTAKGLDEVVFGDIELTLYYPRYQWKSHDHAGTTFAFIKDLKLTVAAEDEDKFIEAKQDTLYSAVNEGSNYINDFDDIELKITTQRRDEPIKSYSRVFVGELPLENVNHRGVPAQDGINESDRPEYHLLAKYLNQYSIPRKKLVQDTTIDYLPYRFVQDSTFPDMRFFITGEEINYRDNISSLTMEQVI